MSFSIEDFRLPGRVALITGVGGRANSIGRAYALGLAAAGAKVALADINIEGARMVAEEVQGAGGEAAAFAVDIADTSSVQKLAREIGETYGDVDILVNNAALMAELSHTPALEVDIEEWGRMFAVNLTGALNCAQVFAPKMKENGWGKIINQASAGAFPAETVYGISKLALVGLTTTLATELGSFNVNVNAIAPGVTRSEAGKAVLPDEFIEFVESKVAMRVAGEPDELVGTLLLLCSEAGRWITGQVINVDGGWVIR